MDSYKTIPSVECGGCSGPVRIHGNAFFHNNGYIPTDTISREVRCIVKSHKECQVTIQKGKVAHSFLADRRIRRRDGLD